MKKAGKLMALLTAALMVVGMLAGCGKPDPDPNSGVYDAAEDYWLQFRPNVIYFSPSMGYGEQMFD